MKIRNGFVSNSSSSSFVICASLPNEKYNSEKMIIQVDLLKLLNNLGFHDKVIKNELELKKYIINYW